MSARCTELHVIDMICLGWCSCLEKAGVKAVGHLEMSCFNVVFSRAPRDWRHFQIVSL